jgi:hypothetical protein
MPKLPNVQQCTVQGSKITQYLLLPRPIDDKSKFFASFGFTLMNWRVLAAALYEHANKYDCTPSRQTPNGVIYVVQCNLTTPDGRNPCIRTFWEVVGIAAPKFVTAYP